MGSNTVKKPWYNTWYINDIKNQVKRLRAAILLLLQSLKSDDYIGGRWIKV